MFSPKSDDLADSGPRLSTLDPPRSWPVQVGATGLGASKAKRATRIPDSTIGAPRATGLDLPKAMDSAFALPEGPEVPPLLAGLPHTPLSACQELMLAIVVRGLEDDDLTYITSATFIHHLLYIGLDPDAALQVKIAYLQGKVQPWRLSLTSLHAQRQARA